MVCACVCLSFVVLFFFVLFCFCLVGWVCCFAVVVFGGSGVAKHITVGHLFT